MPVAFGCVEAADADEIFITLCSLQANFMRQAEIGSNDDSPGAQSKDAQALRRLDNILNFSLGQQHLQQQNKESQSHSIAKTVQPSTHGSTFVLTRWQRTKVECLN